MTVPPIRISDVPVEVAVIPDTVAARISDISVEVAITEIKPIRMSDISVEVVIPSVVPEECHPVIVDAPDNIAARYYVNLYDVNGNKIAMFDDFALEYGDTINGLGYFVLSIRGNDPRRFMFTLDGVVEVMRSIPGAGLTWYPDFHGLARKYARGMTEDGNVYVQFSGPDLNDMLSRTQILYKATTTQARKKGAAETVMKAYVSENCTASALMTNGRLYDHVLPGFVVEPDTGLGSPWEGDRAYENLLDVLSEMANATNIDFKTILVGYPAFQFSTYEYQLGQDRTEGNPSGNTPVVFSAELGNVAKYERSVDYTQERNVVTILGDGENKARLTYTLSATSIDASPWNRRETVRSISSNSDDTPAQRIANMQYSAIEQLYKMMAQESLEFIPLQMPSLLYGLHYTAGDKVTIVEDGVSYNKRLIARKVRLSSDVGQEISFDFRDVP